MGRATIPYDDLQKLAENKYPEPLYMDVTVDRPSRSNRQLMTPTRVYDRSTGNYAPIGWKVSIRFRQFEGIEETYRGFTAKYRQRIFVDILFTD